MNLCIDIGNTSIKVAVFDKDQLILVKSEVESSKILGLIQTYNISSCIISKVGNADIEDLGVPTHFLTHKTKLPIILDYKTPESLGMDRIAAMCAAEEVCPDTDILVVDIGSCITFDYLNSQKEFVGGVISPGPKLRAESMHNFTANLPLISSVTSSELIGKNTKECMESGIYNGISFEIGGFIGSFFEKYQNGKVLLTGGYAKTFESNIKQSIFVDSNLILKGLNRILRFNNEK